MNFYHLKTRKNTKVENMFFVSTSFSSTDEAQRALHHDAFFLFDIHQVLFHRKGISPFIRGLSKVSSKPKMIQLTLQTLFDRTTWAKLKKIYSTGNMITEAYLNTATGHPALHSELLEFSNNIYTPDTDMYKLLQSMAQENHKLYLLSNIGNQTLTRLKRQYPDYFNLLNDADNTINREAKTSCDLVWKPQLNAFEQSLKTIQHQTQPHLAIFIDDKLKNVQAAHKAGLNSIHFLNAQQLKSDLAILMGKELAY